MNIFLAGSTGQVGSRLIPQLTARGDSVVVLTRRPDAVRKAMPAGVELVKGDPMQPGDWTRKIDECDAVINLTGENVFGKRWNARFKQLLLDSRVHSTRNIAQALIRNPTTGAGQPKVLVNASAIGIYGPRGDEEIGEDAPAGSDLLAKLCVEWEKEASAVESAGVRCTRMRIGVVLDKKGGALAKMLTPFKLFVGGPVGSGKQYVSWIHHEDMVGLLLMALDNSASRGPMNATAPTPVTNRDFSRALGKALHRPSFVWTPAFALRLVLGGAAQVVTTGQRILPRQALALGYRFKYSTIQAALANIFGG